MLVTLSVSKVRTGMTLADDLKSSAGVVILPKGTILEEKHIEAIKKYDIHSVSVITDKIDYDESEYVSARRNKTPVKKTALIVDDSESMRMSLRLIIDKIDGFQVIGEAQDGAVALDMARDLKPDLITMDIDMPDLDGVASIAIIKNVLKNVKVIVVSILDDRDNVKDALKAGADNYLLKPFSYQKVRGAILKAFGLKDTENQSPTDK